MAAHYTHGHHESVLRSHQWRTAENSAGYLLEHLSAGQDVLDVGCGPGTITADLARLVAPGPVTAVDPSPRVLDEARRHLLARHVGNVTLLSQDVHGLDFADDSFDVVHAHQVLQHVADPVRALREMRRVCRPDGVVAARDSDYQAMTWYPEMPALDDWLALYRRIARGNGGEPDAGRRLRSWASRAGFTEITASASVWCFTGEDRHWWGEMWADRIVDSDVARLAVSGGYATREQLAAIRQGWLDWVADGDAWFAVLHGEIICRG
ncbi:MAG: methyltransferase domain-containing protein [Micromonosporaceae bacterium]